MPADEAQLSVNQLRWADGDFVRHYSGRGLRPVETTLLERYDNSLNGRLLELGCGGGRLTGHLIEVAQSVHGIDISSRMVEHCRRAYPRASFEQRDLRDLGSFDVDAFDAVLAPFNVLDVLDDSERRRVLSEVHRIMVRGGLLIFSSHNRAFAPRLRPPTWILSRRPLSIIKNVLALPRRLRNHQRLKSLQYSGNGYAIINDDAHDFSLLHYYIGVEDQIEQLTQEHFEPVEVLDLDGRSLGGGERAPTCVELHYVARSK
jgi:SAM-dependent methyltransferase